MTKLSSLKRRKFWHGTKKACSNAKLYYNVYGVDCIPLLLQRMMLTLFSFGFLWSDAQAACALYLVHYYIIFFNHYIKCSDGLLKNHRTKCHFWVRASGFQGPWGYFVSRAPPRFTSTISGFYLAGKRTDQIHSHRLWPQRFWKYPGFSCSFLGPLLRSPGSTFTKLYHLQTVCHTVWFEKLRVWSQHTFRQGRWHCSLT